MKIVHLKHDEIDFKRWDKVISLSSNKLVYAYSWYLNIVSPNWEALIADDYEFVMPLPIKRKYKISYLVQPKMTQQLGIFSLSGITSDIVAHFIKKIPSYSYEINLNENNNHPELDAMPNYVLQLNESYEQIRSKYSKNTIRNIEKTKKNLTINCFLHPDDFLSLYTNVNELSPGQYVLYQLLIEKGIEKESMKIYGAININNELIAALVLLVSHNRFIYLMPVSNADGKKMSAMFAIIDHIIQSNADTDTKLDFEGSAITGIARFYKGFGANLQPYFKLKRFRPSILVGNINKL